LINTACSNDYNALVKTLQYRPCEDCRQFDRTDHTCIYERAEEKKLEKWMYGRIDAIVSTHYEYHAAIKQTEFGYKNFGIPLPIDTAFHVGTPFDISGKLRIYYGETRYGFKGGRYIQEALQAIKRDFPNEVDIVQTSKLDFNQYLKLLNTVHIVIDQANSYSAGMNALYAMARGKIALTGMEKESMKFLGISEANNPCINIRPDAKDIYLKLTALIQSKESLPDLSAKSIQFIKEYHDAGVVADKFLSLYKSLLRIS
jgi:hypothetical protein